MYLPRGIIRGAFVYGVRVLHLHTDIMSIEPIARPLNRAEILLLKKLKKEVSDALKRRFRIWTFIIALLLGVLSAYLAWRIHGGFFKFIFGTLAIFCFAFIIFTPFELRKIRKRMTERIKRADGFLAAGQIKVVPVDALQIALAEEYEDEGDLYIIEYEAGHVLYLWDHNYNLEKRFPCRRFDIYEEAFAQLIDRQLYAISEKTAPVSINRKSKWEYIIKVAWPANLTTEQARFAELVDRYNTVIPVGA